MVESFRTEAVASPISVLHVGATWQISLFGAIIQKKRITFPEKTIAHLCGKSACTLNASYDKSSVTSIPLLIIICQKFSILNLEMIKITRLS
jgi:hypothetical protein